MVNKFAPIHPGEILFEEFLKPMEISQYRLAQDINVPLTRIHAIVHGKRSITADTDLRLSRYFNISKGFWLGLQGHYDLECAEEKLEETLEKTVKCRPVIKENLVADLGIPI